MRIWFLPKTSNNSSIKPYNASDDEKSLSKNLKKHIRQLELQISESTKNIFEAQLVGLRATLDRNSGLLHSVKKKWYKSAVETSTTWHTERLIALYQEKQSLQDQLDRLEGKFWIKRIRKWILYLLSGIVLIFMIWILFMGLITAIYLMPLWISIVVVYIFLHRKGWKRF